MRPPPLWTAFPLGALVGLGLNCATAKPKPVEPPKPVVIVVPRPPPELPDFRRDDPWENTLDL